ncbi:MAG: acyl-CoA reductase [Flavobacteriales bacterium]
MKRQQIISAFSALGQVFEDLLSKEHSKLLNQTEFDQLKAIIAKEQHYNGWFTPEQIHLALQEIRPWLTTEALTAWLSPYAFASSPKTIALILPSNLPLVGFHDFLCVLCSGHSVLVKLSSDDARLLPALAQLLCEFEPELKTRIAFAPTKLSDFDGVIATGSANAMLHFKSYFEKYPHLLRGHRSSVAILDGTETQQELELLGQDILRYFGRGCRNVTQVLIPQDFELNRIFEGLLPMAEVINHKKYGNNYDYNKAVHLLNLSPILDNNFILLKESEELFSPLAMLHYHRYQQQADLSTYLLDNQNEIQCIVGHGYLPFGAAQCPQLNDYADGIDTMQFLGNFA